MNQQPITFEEMKTLYPDEWIFIANPEMDYTEVKRGIVIDHSKDKRVVVQNNIGKGKLYESVTIKFTGTFPSRPKWLTLFAQLRKRGKFNYYSIASRELSC